MPVTSELVHYNKERYALCKRSGVLGPVSSTDSSAATEAVRTTEEHIVVRPREITRSISTTSPEQRNINPFYPLGLFERVHEQSLQCQPGQYVAFHRNVPDDKRPGDTSLHVSEYLRCEYYPEGVTSEVAEEIATYYMNDLTEDSQYNRFGQKIHGDCTTETRKRMCNPDTMVLIIRDPLGDKHGNSSDIVGTVLVSRKDAKGVPAPDLGDNLAPNMQHKGIGITQIVTMLGLCEQEGMVEVGFDVCAYNRNSINSTRRVRDMDVPWTVNFGKLEDGQYNAKFIHDKKLAGANAA